MKKFIMLFASLSLCLMSVVIPVSANNESVPISVETSVTNEYDQLLLMKQLDMQYILMSSPNDTFSEGKTIEQLYLDRAGLDENTLINDYAYTPEQVAILKAYNGEPIEEHPELRLASASLTASLRTGSCSSTQLNIMVDWRWSNAPVFAGPSITDGVAIRWAGTSDAGGPLNLAVINSSTHIYYYNSGSVVAIRSAESIIEGSYSALHAPVIMDQGGGTALSGTLTITLNKTGTDAINEAAITFVYGHCTFGLQVGFSYPYGVGINVTTGTKEVSLSKRVTRNGTIY